ncbi:acetyl-CoA carboxylase, carboxyltransferase subunit beta [Micromonospora arborensis]|uniref:acetyl-CoA carboxylase, carboxyltransferase subunit beta n=1 Tax=Micromonospora arborensis TaxID=2116518 RepID=UPI00340264CE
MTQTTSATADWIACHRCRTLVYGKRLARDLGVCPDCGHHAPITAPQRLAQLLDEGSIVPLPSPVTPEDPLGFVDTVPYPERLRRARESSGLDEAVICVKGTIAGRPVVVTAMDFRFLGGSLGIAVGERITRAADVALAERAPLVMITASGGARMQEGIFALMQMAKTSGALAELDEAGVLTVTIVTDPTYAGVAASFATLADVIIAEPGARMGFTGRRVIEQTIGQRLPDDFQTAEFLLAHGLVDDIRPRAELRSVLARLLTLQADRPGLPDWEDVRDGTARDHADGQDDRATRGGPAARPTGPPSRRDPWENVQRARGIDRPTTLEYLATMMDSFIELHGDRMSGDCPAIVGGPAVLDGRPVMVVGHQKGHSTAELIARDFAMPTPDGYRKAARLMRLAAKLRLPVVTFIDTPGAHPGLEAEERGQAIAIAENLRLMARLPVPIVAVVSGEGGSGGALALGVADRMIAFESSIYSVISPEGCAAILWRDRTMAPSAAAALRIDAASQLRFGVVDEVIPEPDKGVQDDPMLGAERLRKALTVALDELVARPVQELLRDRRRRFRDIGIASVDVDQEGGAK